MLVMNVLVVGAGGHGAVVADILRARHATFGDVRFAGFLDDRYDGADGDASEIRGPVEAFPSVAHDGLVVAVGDNRERQRLQELLAKGGEHLVTVVHPSAVIGGGARLGAGTMVCAGVVVGTESEVGEGVILNTACSIDHHNVIGAFAHVAPGARQGGEVVVQSGALVGIGATIAPRCRVGAWATVGAGAVVVSHVPPAAVVRGVPARVHGDGGSWEGA